MGWPSSHEHDQEKRDDAEFADQESAADLKSLLLAAAEPRKFQRKSAPAPKLKKPKRQKTAEKRYRDRQVNQSVASLSRLQLEAENERLRAENEELRTLIKMRIRVIESHPKRR